MGWCFGWIEDNISEYFDTLSRMLGLGIITFRLDWNFALKFEFVLYTWHDAPETDVARVFVFVTSLRH